MKPPPAMAATSWSSRFDAKPGFRECGEEATPDMG
jgi:hypothetical protein